MLACTEAHYLRIDFIFFLYVVAFGKTKFLQIFKSYNIEAKINGNLHKRFRVTTIA